MLGPSQIIVLWVVPLARGLHANFNMTPCGSRPSWPSRSSSTAPSCPTQRCLSSAFLSSSRFSAVACPTSAGCPSQLDYRSRPLRFVPMLLVVSSASSDLWFSPLLSLSKRRWQQRLLRPPPCVPPTPAWADPVAWREPGWRGLLVAAAMPLSLSTRPHAP